MSSRPDPESLRDLAVEIAREAGALVGARPADLDVHTKSSPTDPVTVMDRKAEALIVQRLRENRPDDGVLGEEGGERQGTSGVRWIVDPIDGTVNYTYGHRAYAVSIAAEHDGIVVAGAIFDARTNTVHEAVLGGGARSDGVPMRCRPTTELALSLVGTGFSYTAERRAEQGARVAALLPKIRDIRRIGSAALDLCNVASGLLDGYFETGLNPWDVAAGLLIAAEAGARVGSFAEGDEEMTVAAAPGVYDELVAAVRAALVGS